MDETLEPTHTPYEEVSSLEDSLPKLDVLYMTRVQKERFFNEEDYIRLKDTYILNREKLQLAKEDMPVLHPLPRVDEIAYDVDDDSRAAYFQQVQNGKYMRMALILSLLGIEDPQTGEKILELGNPKTGDNNMKINIGNHEFTELWDGVLYKALSDYPNVSDNEMKDITMAFYRLR